MTEEEHRLQSDYDGAPAFNQDKNLYKNLLKQHEIDEDSVELSQIASIQKATSILMTSQDLESLEQLALITYIRK